MTKKPTNEPAVEDDGPQDPRKRLLARVAGTVAAGVVSNPSEAAVNATAIATIAVDIAEEILKKIGL